MNSTLPGESSVRDAEIHAISKQERPFSPELPPRNVPSPLLPEAPPPPIPERNNISTTENEYVYFLPNFLQKLRFLLSNCFCFLKFSLIL